MSSNHGHGTYHPRPLGLRAGQVLPGSRIAAKCIRCNRFNTHTSEGLFRHFLSDMAVSWIIESLTPYCLAKKEGGECLREIVSPEDGCSDAG